MKELKDLQVGDEVVILKGATKVLAKINKITKTQIVIGRDRFNKITGRRITGIGWYNKYILIPTPEERAEIYKDMLINRIKYIVDSSKFSNLSTAKLKQVYNIIKSEDKKGK